MTGKELKRLIRKAKRVEAWVSLYLNDGAYIVVQKKDLICAIDQMTKAIKDGVCDADSDEYSASMQGDVLYIN